MVPPIVKKLIDTGLEYPKARELAREKSEGGRVLILYQ
jgi:hypothetical protein